MKVKVVIHDSKVRELGLTRRTEGSAGVDILASIDKPITLKPNETVLISTGISIFIEDPKYAGIILPRSGLGVNKGLILGNTVGLIDSDYQGEIKVCMWYRGDNLVTVEPYDRVAQLVIIPIERFNIEEVESFTVNTSRGINGFGSTGCK